MRKAAGDAWQVMRGEGARVERSCSSILTPGVSRALAALRVAGRDDKRTGDKYLKDFIDIHIFNLQNSLYDGLEIIGFVLILKKNLQLIFY